ncbi:CopY/TcrY family copper transport repressor [Streptococcus saliviloxodontae]|uniref:CopY/TcrY family copper transport repressor n=1 Tax=Streptococcus saliviloxodontae TaxID=1349416 RepID=A0ABS2PN87_9STRE|nr:CopY/TcrY family copper transport repressor [Streptococcus saliviloxodontae]MBM7636752.1 CopY/TcrY family copper transport repressor [Streptococcus saliviloxodontae]
MTISNAEWEIMRVIWTKEETTSSDIIEVLSHKTDWTASTVKTLLKRLVDKGYLVVKKNGRQFLYSPAFSEEESINKQVDDLFGKFCQRKHATILEHLLSETLMTASDVKQLQALLLSKETLEQVPCDCIPGQCRCQEHVEETR